MSLLRPTRLFITTGPESCGKTTLAHALGASWQAPVVGEAARDFLDTRFQQLGHYRYTQDDLLAIAGLQRERELAALAGGPPLVVCDTDLLVIVVWSEVRFGTAAPALRALFEESLTGTERTYLLCDHRVPWVADPQREDPDTRPLLFERYRQALEAYRLDYAISAGSVAERVEQAALLLHTPLCPCCRD